MFAQLYFLLTHREMPAGQENVVPVEKALAPDFFSRRKKQICTESHSSSVHA
jgi:hypothetical protein